MIFEGDIDGEFVKLVDDLLEVLHRLVDAGNTVIVIEHNLDVIKTADWVIDLGPEGGEFGGEVIAEGTPEQVARIPKSYTGQFLRRLVQAETIRQAAHAPVRVPSEPAGPNGESSAAGPGRPVHAGHGRRGRGPRS